MTRKKKLVRARREPSANGAAQDGLIKFDVRGGQYDGHTIEMDPLLVKLSAEELERKHRLEIIDGRYQPTAQFAKDLCTSLVEIGYECTPAIAMRAWVVCADYFADLQKKTN